MSTFFAFSDESGSYRRSRSKKFIKKNPYYIRATFLMDSSEWNSLNRDFINLKKINFGNNWNKEVKWSYLWSIFKYAKKNRVIPSSEPFYFLANLGFQGTYNFIDSALGLLSNLNYIKIIITITKNDSNVQKDENLIYRWHIEDTMQRIEMEIQGQKSNLCVLFIDSISNSIDKLVRNAYNSIYANGKFINKYSHIKDSINIEFSHQSSGIQLADFIAGSIRGLLNGYQYSAQLYGKRIKPYLRKNTVNGEVLGYGVIEVPKDRNIRNTLRNII